MKIRHPEKVNNPINPIKKKPTWIKSKLTNSKEFFLTNYYFFLLDNPFQQKTIFAVQLNYKNFFYYQFSLIFYHTFFDKKKKMKLKISKRKLNFAYCLINGSSNLYKLKSI